jgi:thiosulfate/3-mercaptopyruvate sulfurtransferase
MRERMLIVTASRLGESSPGFLRLETWKMMEDFTMKVLSRRFATCLFLITVLLVPSVMTAFQQGPVRQSMLVSVGWLQQHLNDPGMVILHTGTNRREYKDGHIPGARFLWTQALVFSDPDKTLELPSKAQADSVLRKLGLPEKGSIVLCFDGSNVTPTTRVFFTLDYLGLGDRVSLLDGGLDAWKAAGHPVITETPTLADGIFVPLINANLVAKCDWLNDNLNNPQISIVDARAAQYYSGVGGGMPRPGHIPNAVNIPFSSLVDSTNRLKDPASLRRIFQQAGVKQGSRVVSYCHIGQQATIVYFVAKYLGYEAQVYDGSFEEWSGRKDLPIVNPAAATPPRK